MYPSRRGHLLCPANHHAVIRQPRLSRLNLELGLGRDHVDLQGRASTLLVWRVDHRPTCRVCRFHLLRFQPASLKCFVRCTGEE